MAGRLKIGGECDRQAGSRFGLTGDTFTPFDPDACGDRWKGQTKLDFRADIQSFDMKRVILE